MNKKYLLLSFTALIITLWFLISFSPNKVPLAFTLTPAIDIGVTVYWLFKGLYRFKTSDNAGYSFAKQVPLIAGLTLVMLLVLSSLGQLSIGSFLLVVAFIALASFFISRSTS